jgi:multidrug efflux system outer membrane protein
VNYQVFLLSGLSLIVASCSVGPSYTPPPLDVPTSWKNNDERFRNCEIDETRDLDYWWEVFEDERLNELEMFALENNRDLYVAFERIQEAKALMGIAASAASDFYPQINLSPQYTNTEELLKIFRAQNNGITPLNNAKVFRAHEPFNFLPVTMSYEVDLWGKIRDQYDSSKYLFFAQEKDYEFTMLVLTTNLGIAYFQLRALDSQMDLLLDVLKTRRKAYEINKARFDEQITFYADVTLAEEEVNSALIQYNEVVRQRAVLEDQIAVLLGVPASEFTLEHMPLEGLPPCIPEGVPSDVLLRRPDIAEAEYNVRSDNALVKRAYSLFYPSLTLTAAGGFESPVFKYFLQWISRYWMYGAQANQLIFDGFKTSYNLEREIARFKEASGTYQNQVLKAFQEVEDALKDLESYAQQYEISFKTVGLAEKTYQLYLDRYKAGVIYYIEVANAENDLLNYQMAVNNLQGFRYIYTIQLIKALGGSW